MNDLGKQVCKCIVGACDDTCKYYDAEKSCCVGYEEVVQQAEKVFSEYESYKDLEEQNRLLKLPCAVGDTVYVLNPLLNGKTVIGETTADAFMCALGMLEGRFGKTIFLSLEAAEAALKELRDKKG